MGDTMTNKNLQIKVDVTIFSVGSRTGRKLNFGIQGIEIKKNYFKMKTTQEMKIT